MSDVKYAIRKLDFSYWAKEALVRIEHLIAGRNVPLAKHIDLADELMKEFVFSECDRRGQRRASPPSALQELHALDSICAYLSSSALGETARNTMFLSLFGGAEAPKRARALCRLASVAVSAGCAPALLAIGVWLQQVSCSSAPAAQLAEHLVRDFFALRPPAALDADGALGRLPQIAPQFVANFLAAVADVHLKKRQPGDSFAPPPVALLRVVTEWVCSDPKTCLSAQANPTFFPSGGIPMVAVSPLTGLIQWCALAPLYVFERQDTADVRMEVSPAKKPKLEKLPDQPIFKGETDRTQLTESELYGKLHAGILQSLYEARKPQTNLAIVNAQHLAQAVMPITLRIAQLRKSDSVVGLDRKIEICLIRLAQATQVALSGGCVFGNIPNLLASLGTLPENRMLQIVIRTHQQTLS